MPCGTGSVGRIAAAPESANAPAEEDRDLGPAFERLQKARSLRVLARLLRLVVHVRHLLLVRTRAAIVGHLYALPHRSFHARLTARSDFAPG
eukprot:SAG11_NODE_1288_length_5297_cov_13.005194_4_plen_92_part_00